MKRMNPWWPLIAGCIAAAVVGIAGCGSAPAPHHIGYSGPGGGAAVTAASCLSQAQTWKVTGLPEVQKISADLQTVSTDADTQNLGQVQADVTQLSSDAAVVLGNLPPSCIPGMATDLTTAMNDFQASAASINQGGIGGLQVSTVQIQAATAAVVRATTDLNNWNNAGNPG